MEENGEKKRDTKASFCGRFYTFTLLVIVFLLHCLLQLMLHFLLHYFLCYLYNMIIVFIVILLVTRVTRFTSRPRAISSNIRDLTNVLPYNIY